jgi:protein-tyrosine phosphatase
MRERWIVDVHTHLVPSGDDGVHTIEDAVRLCRQAAAAGTRVLYATPHVHARGGAYPLTPGRLAEYDRSFPLVRRACAAFGLDVRRGFELYPGALLPDADLRDFALTGSGACLIEFPGAWTGEREPLAATWEEAERAERAGLVPVLAHPERCSEVLAAPERLAPFSARGWLLAPNSLSLDGRHGRAARDAVWRLLDAGLGDLVASDAHSDSRPPDLDWAFDLVAARLGDARARALFDGSALEARTRDEEAA